MKKVISILSCLLLLVFSLISVTAAPLVNSNWTQVGESDWAINGDGSISTVAKTEATLINYHLVLTDPGVISGDYTVEVDVPALTGAGEFTALTIRAGADSMFTGFSVQLSQYGLIGNDYDTAVTKNAQSVLAGDTLNSVNVDGSVNHLKIQNTSGKVSVWVNDKLHIDNISIVNRNETGKIVLGVQIAGNKTVAFKNFKLTQGNNVITYFPTVSNDSSSASSGTTSNTDTASPLASFIAVAVMAACISVIALKKKITQ